MANTYSQIYLHVIIVVKRRANLIASHWKLALLKYITGIVTGKKQKLMIINGVADHLHILIGMKPDCCLSDLVRDIKANSSKWINENRYTSVRFEWQEGFAAFSVSNSGVKPVIEYILNQEEHHRKKKFREEYIKLLDEYEIEYKTEYLFEEIE